jgi:tRNA nucleotidyltransferase (CCA-adding enzyme)
VTAVLQRLRADGHQAYVVGGSLRDLLLERPPADWDVATDALPAQVTARFPGSREVARFGTVLLPGPHDAPEVEVTTFRRDHRYRDHRRPDRVTFTKSLTEDLARRDFTVNAMAYGPEGLVDPHGGQADLAARLVRAVGDPAVRFDEDALRLLRAVRLAAVLGFELEPATRRAIRKAAPQLRHVSAERRGSELGRLLAATPPSRGLRLLDETGLLEVLSPDLAAQRGVPQAKVPGDDLWAHTLRTVDAAATLAPGDETLLLAALLHDVGKPTTQAEGHFHGHEVAGAVLAARWLHSLGLPRREIEPVTLLVRWHMFHYEPRWSDAAVRRFLRRVGTAALPRLLLLRRADAIGSGEAPGRDQTAELRARAAAQVDARVPLSLADLAVDGHDLRDELGLPPGPAMGRLLGRLLASVLADPSRNTRATLLADARAWTSGA